jgi:UDP-glucuronate decarboxylase
MVYAYRLEHGLDLKIARIFNAYGPGMRGTDGRVISSFVAQALSGEDVIIYGQGNATRSFQYAGDCVDGLRALMESTWDGGPINIGCETETSIIDLAELVVQRVSKLAGVRIANIRHGDPLPDEPLRRQPNCALAKRVLGWSSKTDLSEGLDRTIKWHMQTGAMSDRASL